MSEFRPILAILTQNLQNITVMLNDAQERVDTAQLQLKMYTQLLNDWQLEMDGKVESGYAIMEGVKRLVQHLNGGENEPHHEESESPCARPFGHQRIEPPEGGKFPDHPPNP